MTYYRDLPAAALAAAKQIPTDHYTKYSGAGIFISSLNGSQLAYEVLHNLHAQDLTWFNWHIYEGTKQPPILPCNTGVFSTLEMASYTGPLVTTCPTTTLQSKIALGPTVIYYVHDPAILQYVGPDVLSEIKKVVSVFVTKTEDHKTFLREKFGIEVQYVIGNFNLAKLEEIITHGLQRN